MAVSKDYLASMRLAVRQLPDEDFDSEITGIIEECRRDLVNLGVDPAKVEDEKDAAIAGLVRSFVRWKFGLNNAEADANRDDYMLQRDEIRKRVEYVLEQ